MASAKERRLAVRNAYRKYIGRNHYSNARRNYCVKPYKDGVYYSDCSSSVSYAYQETGEGFGILNTVGMWNSKKLEDVPVTINKNGTIANPEALRIGDMLLFAGNDTSRKAAGYVGHVEMVGEISGSTITLYGHGSGLAKKHEMNAYCKSRRSAKASTPLGHRGLIRVRRAIADDAEAEPTSQGNEIRRGGKGAAVQAMQQLLLRWDPNCLPVYGADGDFGSETETAVKALQALVALPASGVFDDETASALALRICNEIIITGGTVNIRSGPGTNYAKIGLVYQGDKLVFNGQHTADGWYGVQYTGMAAWVSDKYARLNT